MYTGSSDIYIYVCMCMYAPLSGSTYIDLDLLSPRVPVRPSNTSDAILDTVCVFLALVRERSFTTSTSSSPAGRPMSSSWVNIYHAFD
jgi:hypothetical protein